MSGQPQPQFDLEVDDYPLPPIVFDPGEADECERDVAAASYNYSGLMAIGKPKRKKTMALVIDAEELFKANQQLAMNAAQDFADAVKSERVSVLESLGEDEAPLAAAEDAGYDAEPDFAPGLDEFDDQVDAAVLAWSTRTVILSDEADLADEEADEDRAAAVESAANAATLAVTPRTALPVESVEPVDETPAESILERAARLRDAIPPAPVIPAAPPVASAPPAAPEWTAPDVADEPEAAPAQRFAEEPAFAYQEPEQRIAQPLAAEPVHAVEVAFEPEREHVAAPAPAPKPVGNHGHALRARMVREPVEATQGANGGRGLIARFLAWLAGLHR